jgi:NAD(P)-dependent dehydrogenase (short-subunit alcohol dehydrogenase family)
MTVLAGPLLDNKVALVSGIGPGMGRDIALLFAEHGADVVLGARTEANVASVAKEVEAAGRRAVGVTLDITDVDSCANAVQRATSELGRVDILVNNAFEDGDHKKFERADIDHRWRQTMDTNFFGTMHLTQAVVPVMKEQGDGRIVMVNSMSSVYAQERQGAYAASKAALAAVTKTLAIELGGYGIRVNGVHPGYIWSDKVEMYLQFLAEREGITYEQKKAALEAETCLGYLPHSSEIAGSVLFFASDLSKPVTGQALGVNAGHWFQGF